MKKSKKKAIRLCMGGLFLLLICGLALYGVTAAYERKADSKEFVDWLIEHADEASADFADCGLVFSAAEEGDIRTGAAADMLIVTDADGWRFCYQTSKKYGDMLVKIEGSIERVHVLAGNKEMITGSLEIETRKNNYAYVIVDCDADVYMEIRTLNYCVPEFDRYPAAFKADITAQRISRWISNEELAALYKKGKELEEILSAYCELKDHNVGVSIGYYAAP